MKHKRKGQLALSQLPSAVIFLTVTILMVTITGIILAKLQTSQEKLETRQTQNESIVFLYGGLYNLTNTPVSSIVQVQNNSAGTIETLESANYTLSGNSVNLTFATVTNNTPFNFTVNVTLNGTQAQVIEVVEGYNANNGTRYTAGNFTVLGGGRNLVNYSAGATARNTPVNLTWRFVRYNNSRLNVTYNYDNRVQDEPFNITGQGLSAVETLSDFFDPIAVIIAAVIVIGLILGAFILAGTGRRSQPAV